MATTKTVVRKNGMPVKRFWREKVTAKRRETFSSTFPVYFHGTFNDASLTEEKAPRSLAEAEHTAKLLIESSDTEYTLAVVYELRAVVRYGVEYDHKLYDAEQRAARGPVPMTFRRVATTESAG